MSLMIVFSLGLFLLTGSVSPSGLLYPRASETRNQISLDGIWNFALSPQEDLNLGFKNGWYKKDLTRVEDIDYVHLMPVPGSYNDITVDAEIRDFVGIVWYDRTFFVPNHWPKTNIFLRFGSVAYSAQVFLNGELALSHEIGHLPFEAEISPYLKFGEENRISLAIDNRLGPTTIPQGKLNNKTTDEGVKLNNTYTYDFFNYAGIHRPVVLYTKPESYIDDITVTYDIDFEGNAATGYINYKISYVSDMNPADLRVSFNLLDKTSSLAEFSVNDQEVLEDEFVGKISIPNAKIWWPYLMNEDPGYMYTLEVKLSSSTQASEDLLDIYRLPVGIRTVSWSNSQLLINNVPVYLRGFGRHEDSDIRGKGLDLPLTVRDYNLIKWMGANVYRTSHYPYAEEIMDLADQNGIMIIDESPAVNIEGFSDELLQNHKASLNQLIKRDKNRPSVVIWSVANEPRSEHEESDPYFGEIISYVKELDPTRPTTIALVRLLEEDHVAKHLDIISINRYYGWYSHTGDLDMVKNIIKGDVIGFWETYNRPVLITEYGADTLEGYHKLPSFVWSEEFQEQFMSEYFTAFDELRADGYFLGELHWNFADYKTPQEARRLSGNKKGVFTRDRQPKGSAYLLRKRYWLLAEEYGNVSPPKDLENYASVKTIRHIEL